MSAQDLIDRIKDVKNITEDEALALYSTYAYTNYTEDFYGREENITDEAFKILKDDGCKIPYTTTIRDNMLHSENANVRAYAFTTIGGLFGTSSEEEKMAENKIKTIGVLTSGGDAPGMNAAIRAVVRRGLSNGLNVKGILKGYNGLLNEEIIDMSAKDVSDTIERGGTILYTARCAEFRTEEGQKRGAEICRKHGIDGLVVIGGDGSFAGAQKLANLGINTIGLPGTIDLDIACTEYTIGFDTAVNTAMEAIDKVRDTSTSHERCSIIEVMGRGAGYIALWCGIANGAEDVLVPEKYDYDEQKLINNIIESRKKGKKHHIIINAEGIGHSEAMAKRIEAATGIETRATILGHMQRGGSPTCKDRVYASMMGALAVDLLIAGKTCRVVGYRHGEFVDFDINEALAMQKGISDYQWEVCQSLSHNYDKNNK